MGNSKENCLHLSKKEIQNILLDKFMKDNCVTENLLSDVQLILCLLDERDYYLGNLTNDEVIEILNFVCTK